MDGEDNNSGGGDTTTQADPETVAKARDLGWVDQETFRGDPEKWVPADEFLRKGEEVLPLIRATNRKLNERLSATVNENQTLKSQLQELQESVTAMQEIQNRENKGRVERQVTVLRRQIEEARTERDPDKVVELQAKLDTVLEERGNLEKPVEKKPEVKPEGARINPRVAQEMRTWEEANPWWGTNGVKTRIANSIGEELRNDPEFEGIVGKPFLDEVTRRTNEAYDAEFGGRSNGVGKTLDGGAGRGGGGGTVRGKSYNMLPPDAKAACEGDIERVVGSNKSFKTPDAYRVWYTNEYFGDEA